MTDKKETAILIVDDEEWIRDLLKDILETNGYRTKTAKNGTDAIKKIKQESFNVVICDINMPKLSGFDVLKQVRLIDSSIKIIMMTANGNEYYYNQCMSMGASGFIGKPFDMQEMLAAIEYSTGKNSFTD
ncbi:MAG: hypothetical protein A2452_02950 [Candidatus Firestonebacteria bacterium RIFOXYC2_FULL_39_67]|nr:MAG: hypothetical protein A2536_02365 [Candidatus Firestonebacteria bacterium RIFOXYD2_FULL_39_29]OGF55414.1 MAG: hypothetical protein A2452_02950 [Candidatus Firestonebacteria bacterium RIFOXYC2_FULL_39_67]OGF57944.1 MAG: hypothetical protein A2497_06695 [Candidatus Firestonebacteria bacterium RifOxyC12_full_39_7]